MFENLRLEKNLWGWRWPLTFVVALFVLLVLQVIRVNDPRRPSHIERIEYSSPGPLVSKSIVVPAESYYPIRINLNRRAKIYGTFRTGDLKSSVDVVVLDDANFEKWKIGSEYRSIIQTGYVPGGRIAPVVEPGTYHLVIDNRRSTLPQALDSDFALE